MGRWYSVLGYLVIPLHGKRKNIGAEFMTLVSGSGLVKGCICALYCYTAKDFLNIATKAK